MTQILHNLINDLLFLDNARDIRWIIKATAIERSRPQENILTQNSSGFSAGTLWHDLVFPSVLTHRRFGKALILPTIVAVLTASPAMAATAPVNLGKAGTFVILSETGITDVPSSAVTGNVGTSPITGAADLLTCTEVNGRVFSVDAAGPAPCSKPRAGMLRKAVLSMQKAYTDAAGRVPTVTELGAGNIGGLTLPPGVYGWSSSLTIPANVTLKGSATDVWILQVAQNVNIASATAILLRGGANPANVFWQVAGSVTMGSAAKFQGVILSANAINMGTNASIHGRLFAQTAVSLQMNKVTRSTMPKARVPE
jgi:hypothetical protein